MSLAYPIKPSIEKKHEIDSLLQGYWLNDIWDITEKFFDELRPIKWSLFSKIIDFTPFTEPIKTEIKYMYAARLLNREFKLATAVNYGRVFNLFSEFLSNYYKNISSIIEIPYEKGLLQWRCFLIAKGFSNCKQGKGNTMQHETVIAQIHTFFTNFYDTREEFEKDIWDCRKIPGAKLRANDAAYYLDFTCIPNIFRNLVKRYIKYVLATKSQNLCYSTIRSLSLFTTYIHEKEPCWIDLKNLTRKHMEDYLSWFKGYTEGWKGKQYDYFFNLRAFLNYIQRAQYNEAPELSIICLIFDEDMQKKRSLRNNNEVKYIPEGVLHQFEDNLEFLTPCEYIPIVILLRASGWRISDILNLRYDNCLDRTPQGWYLRGDIIKTQVLNHRVPITDEVAAVIQAAIEETKRKGSNANNPNCLLFVRFDGKRKGRCPQGALIRNALNRLAQRQNITDDQGNVFHFGNHAFRHTKAIELINNGMSLLHVQKWMAHASPEMTLTYAKILDTTMRKSWEEATKQGLFRLDNAGNLKKIDISDIENEDIIEWEYIRHNLDAVRMPLGYCMKPKKQECHTQLNPCLTCRNLCTTPEFIPQYELEIQETKAIIEKGRTQNRSVWVEKNQALLERYESVLKILKTGKIHHKAGKKGREYTREELANGQ